MLNKKSIKKNYLYNLIYQILLIFLPIITIPYLSRILGAENIGIYSYTVTIASYFILFGSLGTQKYGQREIAYLQDDKYKRSMVFFEIFLVRVIFLTISMTVFYFSFGTDGKYSIYYKILLLEIIANCLDISWFFQGLEEFKKTVLRNLIVKLISITLIFIFVKTQYDLKKYMFLYVFSVLFGNISLWLYLPKYISKINIKEINITRHLKSIIGLFIPQIAIQLYTMIDKTMIGSMIDDKSEVGFYDQAQKVIKILLTLAIAIENVMSARIANVFASGDMNKVLYYMKRSFQFILILAFPLAVGVFGVSNRFVPLFFGNGYYKVIDLIRVICPIIILMSMSNVIGMQYLLSTKKQKEFTISVIIGAIVNVCFNVFLISNFKSIGASIASVIAEFTVVGVQFYIIRKDIKIIDIIKMSKWYIIGSIAIIVWCCVIDRLISSNLICLIVQIIVSAITYFGILLFAKDNFVMDCIKMISSKIHQYF